MGHANLDHNFRTKLESRKITPSADAWDKLEAQLSPKNTFQRRRRMWYGVAASVSILCIISLYFSSILRSEKIHSHIENGTPLTSPSQQSGVPIEKKIPLLQEIPTTKAVTTKKKLPTQKPTRVLEAIAADHTPQTHLPDQQAVQKSFEDQKVAEVVIKIQQLQQHKASVTDTEIDLLLAQAQQEINLRKSLTDTLAKVDAMALLAEVEEALDQSFKEKVFEALKEGFYKVKTAVAERNH